MVKNQNACGNRGQSAYGRNLEDVLNQLYVSSDRTGSCGFTPAVNIVETEDAYELLLELPGVDADAINIQYQENVLTVSGERKAPEDSENRKYHRVEHRYGPFQRTFRLAEIDADGITAGFVNGELAVQAPKLPAVVARKIPVNTGPKS